MKPVDLDALLAITDDGELCDAVFCRFAEFNNQINVDAYTEEERVVTLVWHASGIIGNGGFEYLFEGDFNGDSGFMYTAAAFKMIGAAESYAAFQRARGAFGGHYPTDPKQRIAAFHHVPEHERTMISRQFWDDDHNMRSGLARYIRERHERFRQLLSAPPKKPNLLQRLFR
jgi:hypothetical protein